MLFEYSGFIPTADRDGLESFLIKIWRERQFAYWKEVLLESGDTTEEEPVATYQPFLRFDGSTFRTQNFIGFIQSANELIEIYPKVFKYDSAIPRSVILDHVFYWLSYCRRLQFPILNTNLDRHDVNTIPEILIWHFTTYCEGILFTLPYSRYEEIQESLQSPRGRIDFKNYFKNGLSTGQWQEIDCIHEPFVFDNLLNQTIKFVCRSLIEITRIHRTQNMLQQILFLLDDVQDRVVTHNELDKIVLNPIFGDYQPIIAWCKRFLQQQLYAAGAYNETQWSMLIPMEYVFEDFIASFIKKHYSPLFHVRTQASELYLSADPQAFNLIQDLVITNISTGEVIIIDTKYKSRWNVAESDLKRGVSPNDMYQMVSYAIRRKGCRKVLLLYPNVQDGLQEDATFKIRYEGDQQGYGENIQITVAEVPFWSSGGTRMLDSKLKQKLDLLLEVEVLAVKKF